MKLRANYQIGDRTGSPTPAVHPQFGGLRDFSTPFSNSTRGDQRPVALRRSQSGSVLIIVLWIALGLVAITLYFANSMSSELRASDNRISLLAADQSH
jgi:hypothetical protein